MSNVCKPCSTPGHICMMLSYLTPLKSLRSFRRPERYREAPTRGLPARSFLRFWYSASCSCMWALSGSIIPHSFAVAFGREYHRAIEAALYQQRHHAGMVYMRVGYEQRLYIRRYGENPRCVNSMRLRPCRIPQSTSISLRPRRLSCGMNP